MVERREIVSQPDHEYLSELRISLRDAVNFSVLENSANLENADGSLLCTINSDGLGILGPLLAGKSIRETADIIETQYPDIPEAKIEQNMIIFIRKLYAQELILLKNKDGNVEKITSWEMEPVCNAHTFITHRCNLKCIHCLIVPERREELTILEWKNAVDELIDLGCVNLDITGGEVATKRGFLDLIDYATSKNLEVGVATNGTIWKEEDIERLIALKPEKVNISIYSGEPDVHDGITGSNGSFEKSIKLAARISESGIRVNFKCMIMRENFNSFAGVAELADRIGAHCQFDVHITGKTNGDTSPLSHRINLEELKEFVRSPWCQPPKERLVTPNMIVCNAGVDRISINAYGDVHPCVVFPIKVGNIKEQSLVEIWGNSPLLNEVMSLTFQDFGNCGSCSFLTKCSPCPGASYLEQGNFRESPKWSCNYAKIVYTKEKGGDENVSRER